MSQLPDDPHKHRPPHDADETVHADDSVIGRALRWSLIAVVVIGASATGIYFLAQRKPPAPPQRVTHLVAPVAPTNAPAAQPPLVKFTDITAAAGISFRHFNSASPEKLLPETMGGGVAFLDLDADGDEDLLFVNGAPWPWLPHSGPAPTHRLYANDGTGKFTDVTAGSGLDASFFGMGAAVGDYDNDGLPDIFTTGVGGSRLFHNQGKGKFADVTASAGVGGGAGDWASAAAWADFDNDGRLDLFVGHYVKWSREIDSKVGYKIDGKTRAYGQPMNFQGTLPSLFRNEGGGKFRDVSAASGVQVTNAATGVPLAKTLGVAPVDVDGDGWMDIVVANDTVQNFLLHNQRDGTFREAGTTGGIAYDSYGNARGAMGVDVARFREDDALGILIGNFANEMNALYVASAKNPLLFTDEAITEGIGPASRLPLKFGVFFFDYDLDGRLDALSANGHLEEEIAKIQSSQRYRQAAQLFWNCGPGNASGCFVSVDAARSGADLFQPIVGRGSAYADVDGDGDLDVVLTQVGGAPLLLRNDRAPGANWLRLRLTGTKSNRDAVGAWVKVRVEGRTLWRQVGRTKSYLSQSELPVTIGLGTATKTESVEVIWPGGKRQMVEAKLGAVTEVREEE